MNAIKDKLIQVAMGTVQKSGTNSLTMRVLGEAVGIKSSSVMYHFKNKDGLIDNLIQIYSDGFLNYLDEINQMHADKKKRLDAFVDIFENVLYENKFCLGGMLASENESLDDITTQRTQNFFMQAQKWLSLNLEGSIDVDSMSLVIISSLEGAILLDKLDGKTSRINAVRKWIQSLYKE